MIEPELERYLARLAHALDRLPRRERERALREARDHLLCAAEAAEAGGRAHHEALGTAIAAFGPAETVAAGYSRPPRARPTLLRAASLAAVAALGALAFAPTGSRLGQIVMPTSHASDTACAGRWNQQPTRTGYRLARVSSPQPACEVILHDARTARVFLQDAPDGHWRAIVRAGESSWPLVRVPVLAQSHAFRVDPDGRLGRRIG